MLHQVESPTFLMDKPFFFLRDFIKVGATMVRTLSQALSPHRANPPNSIDFVPHRRGILSLYWLHDRSPVTDSLLQRLCRPCVLA